MFKKPFRVKSQTSMKGSDRKKLRAEMSKAFAGLSQDNLTSILPNKEDVTSVKLSTQSGDTVFVYCVNKQPLLWEVDKEKVLFPTVYLLWKFPDLITRFTTWPPVFRKLVDGADLMLPGLVVREQVTPNTFKHIQKGQTCSVNVVGNKAPLVLGYTLLSGTDFYDSGMKGKGVRLLHCYGDELWSYGDRSKPPDLEDDPIPHELLDDDDNSGTESQEEAAGVDTDQMTGVVESAGGAGAGIEKGAISEDAMLEGATGVETVNIGGLTLQDGEMLDNGPEDDVESAESAASTPEQMDELLQYCFLCALKSSVKKADLPMLTAAFYKTHMLKFCPPGVHIDMKKSSFKKLSKFLRHQQETGIITIKEVTKGVDNLIEVDKSHELLRGFEAPELPETEPPSGQTDNKISAPQITELYAVNNETLQVFQGLGYRKGDSLTSQDVRKCVTEYIKGNNMQDENAKNLVVLDPLLASLLLTKAEGDRGTLTWDAVFSRLQNKMSNVYEIALAGQAPYIRKGKIEPIKLDVQQKASNKKVTVVENLDSFGIDARDFGHTVQVKMACSASVSPSQQKNKGPVVLVQGNQINFVANLLTDTYQIPKKFLKGIEKAPKTKRR